MPPVDSKSQNAKKRIVDQQTIVKTSELILEKAKSHGVSAWQIIEHSRYARIHQARLEVWKVMVGEWGLKRTYVAKMFNRDIRRLRKSVIGV